MISAGLAHGWISPCKSPWCAQTVTKTRICVDFRLLNERTVPDKYSPTFVWDILEALGNSMYISVSDLKKAYHLESQAPDGQQYHFNVLPFGLRNAPSFFNKEMSQILGTIPNGYTYFDDIPTGGENFEEHYKALEQQIQRMRDNKSFVPRQMQLRLLGVRYPGIASNCR